MGKGNPNPAQPDLKGKRMAVWVKFACGCEEGVNIRLTETCPLHGEPVVEWNDEGLAVPPREGWRPLEGIRPRVS